MTRKHGEEDEVCDLNGMPVDLVVHVRECKRRWREMDQKYIPVIEGLGVDRIRVVTAATVVTFAWGMIGAAVCWGIQTKVEQAKTEMIREVQKSRVP